MDSIEDVLLVSDEEAFVASKVLASSYGLFVGLTSSANYHVAKLCR